MMWTLSIVFALLWALGLSTGHPLEGFIHVFILVAALLFFARIIKGPGYKYPKSHGHTSE